MNERTSVIKRSELWNKIYDIVKQIPRADTNGMDAVDAPSAATSIEEMLAKDEYRYVWLNMPDGKFSNSWDEESHTNLMDEDIINSAENNGYKLIRYKCLNDDDFEFINHMKFK